MKAKQNDASAKAAAAILQRFVNAARKLGWGEMGLVDEVLRAVDEGAAKEILAKWVRQPANPADERLDLLPKDREWTVLSTVHRNITGRVVELDIVPAVEPDGDHSIRINSDDLEVRAAKERGMSGLADAVAFYERRDQIPSRLCRCTFLFPGTVLMSGGGRYIPALIRSKETGEWEIAVRRLGKKVWFYANEYLIRPRKPQTEYRGFSLELYP